MQFTPNLALKCSFLHYLALKTNTKKSHFINCAKKAKKGLIVYCHIIGSKPVCLRVLFLQKLFERMPIEVPKKYYSVRGKSVYLFGLCTK